MDLVVNSPPRAPRKVIGGSSAIAPSIGYSLPSTIEERKKAAKLTALFLDLSF